MSTVKHWYSLMDTKPSKGKCVVMLFTNGTGDPDCWTTDIGYYCNDGFYKLEYDEHLDILRKVFVTEKVEYWSDYIQHDVSEITSL